MKVHPTMLLKTKDDQNLPPGYPTMLLKTMDSIFRSGYHIESRTLSNTVGTPGQGPSRGRHTRRQGSSRAPDTPHRGLQVIFERALLGNRQVGGFGARHASETNPTELTYSVASRYKDSGENKPKPAIFRIIYGLRRKKARFSGNLNAERD